MKIIGNFLFCNQIFLDIDESKPLIISLDSIEFIKCTYVRLHEKLVKLAEIIMVSGAELCVDYDPDEFAIDFAKLIEEKQKNEETCCNQI